MQLQNVYSVRSKAIQACVDETSANVSQLSAARDSNPSNRDEIVRQLRKEQTKVHTCIRTWLKITLVDLCIFMAVA